MFTLINKKGENMKRLRLKKWVIPTFGTLLVVMILSIFMIGKSFDEDKGQDNDYVVNALIDNSTPVVEIKDSKMILPYTNDKVITSKNFYSMNDDETKQESSLIYYENIYIQNTGILYSSDEQFDVVSVLDGTVKNIKEDELLGFVIEIENTDSVTTIYQSVDNITVKIGDFVEKGKIIATSGNNALSNEKDNCLHFEVYIDGKLTNPEILYNKEIKK